jgi:hypothetical protein
VSYLALARRIIAERGLEAEEPVAREAPSDAGAFVAASERARDAYSRRRTWIIAGRSEGAMRLAIGSDPPWPEAVFRAGALVEVIDRWHRAGRDREAEGAAIELEGVLGELRRSGIEAWLTS